MQPAPDCPARQMRRGAFTLVEMVGVMAIIIIIIGVAAPVVWKLLGNNNFTSSTAGIASTLEQARAYAMGNNTYVYVGFGEYVEGESTSTSPRTAGVGQLAIAIVAARDGTNGTTSWSTNYASGALLSTADKLHLYDNVHLADFSSATPVPAGNMARPVPAPVNGNAGGNFVGNSAFVAQTAFAWPLGSSLSTPVPPATPGPGQTAQYVFTKVIQFDPQGVARLQQGAALDAMTAYMEIDLQPSFANIAPSPAVPTDQNSGNQSAIQLDCMNGIVRVYRP